MSNILFNWIIAPLFKGSLNERSILDTSKGYQNGVLDQAKALKRKEDDNFQLKKDILINQPIIGVSNEYQNPVIGIITGFDDTWAGSTPTPIVMNYVEPGLVVHLGGYKIYTHQLYQAILKLTPEERAAMLFDHYYNGREVQFNKELSCAEEILSPDELTQTLELNGFFKKLEEIKEVQE